MFSANNANWSLSIVTPPIDEPVTLEEVKAHLRVDFDDDDFYIAALIYAAREITEQKTNRALITQTWDYILDDFPCVNEIKLRKPSLQSVTSVNYTTSDGVEHVMSTDDYIVDTKSNPGRIFLGFSKIWPPVVLQPASAVRIRFVAGYSSGNEVPQALKHAMFFLIAHFYENREPISKDIVNKIPMTFDFLIGPYRVVTLQ
ncbi:phage head-tail connector protein [Paenibacillus frigoriresistens]|uniref:head-tail connector protein n=1 Tax=Paenibacillus alginolyticus TaxID=59839 RepID=UPI00156703B9|nr:head-tail connector protein [Paenibacillus frigoriresistens]NRF91535.1 phage head-tail connector protein [Paenibacillus frigoriresistens]